MKFAPSIPVEDVGKKIDNLSGQIKFDKVSFSYSNRKDSVSKNIHTLDVFKPGVKVDYIFLESFGLV